MDEKSGQHEPPSEPNKRKKHKKGYSEQAIELSTVNMDPDFERIPVIKMMYGIITPYSGEDGIIWINFEQFSEEQIIKKLNDLSISSGRAYHISFIPGDNYEEGDGMGLVIIGIPLKGNVMEAREGSATISPRRNLVHVVNETDQMIADLESIGFKGIDRHDFHLLAGYSSD